MDFTPRPESHFPLNVLDVVRENPVEIHPSKTTTPIYDFKVVLDGNHYTWFLFRIFGVKSKMRSDDKNLNHIPHDTVANLMSGKTDVVLSSVGVTGPLSNLSPDFVDGEKKVVIELTTSASTDLDFMKQKYKDKKRNYQYLESEHGFEVGVVVVNPEFVYSNMEMSPETSAALVTRCRTGLALKSAVENYLGRPIQNEDLGPAERIVEQTMEDLSDRLPVSYKDFPIKEILSCRSKISERESKIAADIIKASLLESKQRSTETDKVIKDYIESYDGSSRTDLKRITNVPLVCPKDDPTESYKLEESDIWDSEMPTWMKKIWSDALEVDVEKTSLERTIEEEVNIAMGNVEFDRHYVQKACAFNTKLSNSDREEASTTGLWGKEMKTSEKYSEHYKRTKVGFHPIDTPTSDIEDFMNTDLFTKSNYKFPPSILNLLKDGKSVWKEGLKKAEDSMSELIFKTIVQTKMISFCQLLTEIFTEICYCYKYWIKRSDFYHKFYKGIHLLIRCTGDHVFIAMAYNKSLYESFDTGRLGPTLFETSKFIFTDFQSYNEPAIEHFVKAGPYLTSLTAHMLSSYEQPLDDLNLHSPNIFRNMNGILLLYLNNKTDAEEVITNQRYLTMLMLEELDANPYKFSSRLPEFIKSRLTCYLVKRTLNLMTNFAHEKPKKIKVKEEGIEELEIDGLVGFFTNEPVTMRQKVGEFYFGYVISKERGRGSDRNFKIMKKIVAEEYKYRDANFLLFSKSAKTIDGQTNLPLMKMFLSLFRLIMKEKYGSEWKGHFKRTTIEWMAKGSFYDLATLKVSSRSYGQIIIVPSFTEHMKTSELMDLLREANPNEVESRPRVMEALTELISEYRKVSSYKGDIDHPIQLLRYCLVDIEKRGYFDSDIFPKAQHGGDREIHVIEMKSRIVQYFLEKISRSMCSLIASDSLTHTRHKDNFVRDHYRQTSLELKDKHITLGKSSDATKWCQKNHPSKFAGMLIGLTDPIFHHFILRTLSMWPKKRITFPVQFAANFISNKTVKSNKVYERMRKEFFSGTGIFPFPMNNKIEIKSGMMQGILHYTSSLCHGFIQEVCAKLQHRFLNGKKIPNVITIIQGSDDSAEMISLSGLKSSSLCQLGTTMLIWKEKLARHFSIFTSTAKSCIGSIDLVEYNSEWYLGTSSIKPTFRWVSACLEVGVVEKFIDRLHHFYGSITDVLSGGGKVLEVAVIQMCQAWMHYHMLGLSSHKLSIKTSEMLILCKDPALGYFPLDPDVSAGICGVNFQLYKLFKDTRFGYGLRGLNLQTTEIDMFEEDSRDPSLSRSLRRIKLKFGNNKLFTNILRRMEIPDLEELISEVENNPTILYYPERSWDRSISRIYMKVFEPGVKESLSKHSATARILSASAYLISSPCLINFELDTKVSLYRSLHNYVIKSISGSLRKRSIQQIFIHHLEYKNLLVDIESLQSKHILTRAHMKARTKQKLLIFDRQSNDVPILEMCKQAWFDNGKTGFSKTQFWIKWKELKTRYTFLHDKRANTKENLNFNEVQLKNFLDSLTERPRHITLMDSTAKGSSVYSAMTRIYWSNTKLVTEQSLETHETVSSLRSQVFSILSYWCSDAEKQHKIHKLLTESEILSKDTVPNRLSKLLMITKWRKGLDKQKIIEEIVQDSIGFVGAFTISQRGYGKNREGLGEWKGKCLDSSIKILFMGPVCTNITVSNLFRSKEIGQHLIDLIKTFQSSFPDELLPSNHWLTENGKINGGKGSQRAIPIELDPDLKVTIFDDFSKCHWDWDFSNCRIRLRASLSSDAKVTFLSDTFGSYEWDSIYPINDDTFREWSSSIPIKLEDLEQEFSNLFNGRFPDVAKELQSIKKLKSSSGWELMNFRKSLLRYSKILSTAFTSSDIDPDLETDADDILSELNETDLEFIQQLNTGKIDIDVGLFDDLVQTGTDDYVFDLDDDTLRNMESTIEMLLSSSDHKKEISEGREDMPVTNRYFSNLETLSRMTTGNTLAKSYQIMVDNPHIKCSGLLGKILSLMTLRPCTRSAASKLEADLISKEDSIASLTTSLRTERDLLNISREDLIQSIESLEATISSAPTILKSSYMETLQRFRRVLALRDHPPSPVSFDDLPSSNLLIDLKPWIKKLSNKLDYVCTLSDSFFIPIIRNLLDEHIEAMVLNGTLTEYEMGLYRESISKPLVSTLLLDVLANWLSITIESANYVTGDNLTDVFRLD